VTVREERAIAVKPRNVTFEQAAAVPIAAITALQALRDTGKIRAGQKVLINGASGGVGTYAVQLAKAFGADVTGVCSTKNLELVRSLGADHVIDYTREDFTKGSEHYDLILDTVSTHSPLEYRHAMAPKGIYVMVGSTETGHWFGFFTKPIEGMLLAPFVGQSFKMMLAELNRKDLATLADLMQSGKVTSVIDHRYPLSDTAEALRYLEKGHARGKVVLDVDSGS
jgi:NADPH:quinone reductase-like Zn-dependent oxidoreductase